MTFTLKGCIFVLSITQKSKTMKKIKYKGFKIKLIVDEFADSPLDSQSLPEQFFIDRAHRRETGINKAYLLAGKINPDSKTAEFFEFDEEYYLSPGEYLFELHELEEWATCENPEQQAKNYINALAKELYYYHNGECYGYEVKYKKEVVDSCWGFYGSEWAIESAKNFIDGYSEESLLELDLPAKVVLK